MAGNISVGGTGIVTTGTGTVIGDEGTGIINTLSGNISGAGAFTQSGPGTTILTGSDTYTGATTVSAGTLRVGNGTTGSISNSSASTVLRVGLWPSTKRMAGATLERL